MSVPLAVSLIVNLKCSHPQRRLPLRHCVDDRSSVRLFASFECSLSEVDRIVKLSNYWKGLEPSPPFMRRPINVCVFASSEPEVHSKIAELVKNPLFSTKVTLSVVYSPFYSTLFPENMLKNIAISTVFTTHFIMIESTMLPSCECPFIGLTHSHALRAIAKCSCESPLRAH